MDLSPKLVMLAKTFFKEILEEIPAQERSNFSAIIVGSASIGHADKHSDADGKIICWKPTKLKSRTKTIDGHKLAFEVTTIDEFCIKGLLEDHEWSTVSPFGLFAVSHAIVIHDPKKRFETIQKRVNQYYPPPVWKQHIRSTWRSLLEDGEYNLRRDVKRGKEHMSYLHASNALWHSVTLCFLLNRRYYPTHHQWLYDEFTQLPRISRSIRPLMAKVTRTKSPAVRQENIERIISILRAYLKKHQLIDPPQLTQWWLIPWR